MVPQSEPLSSCTCTRSPGIQRVNFYGTSIRQLALTMDVKIPEP